MKPESSSHRSSGRAVRVCQGLAPVEGVGAELECVQGSRSPGQVIRVCQALPPVEMVAVASEDVFLELTLTLTQPADANHVLGKVVQLVESLHAYEQSL